jgi:hypothetical protein
MPDTDLVIPNGEQVMPTIWWSQYREVSLNWLALGVLLAAWNASSNDTADPVHRRPEALRGYSSVTVRAVYLRKSHKSVNVL